MTCTPVQVGEVRAIVYTTRRKPRLGACGREAPYLCDEPSERAKKKACDQPLYDRCVASLGDNRHRCPSCELRERTSPAPPPVPASRVQEPAREQVGLFGAVLTWRSPARPASRPVAGDQLGGDCIPEVDEMGAARARLVQAICSLWRAQATHEGTRPAGAPVLQGFDSSGPPAPSRWVICPDRLTGSMDAVEVRPAASKEPARRMVARERASVGLYEVHGSGSWTPRGRMRVNPGGRMNVGPSREVKPKLGFATKAWLQFVEHDDGRVDLVGLEHHQHRGLLSFVVDNTSEREAKARRAALRAVQERTGLPWGGA